MRYVLIDRFCELRKGERARAVKCVTRGEAFLRDLPAYPPALVLEALFQTGGVLACAATGYARMSILGKVESAEFPSLARAGDRIDLEVNVILSRPEGTLLKGVATVGERIVARAEFMIVYVPPELEPPQDPGTEKLRRLLRHALRIPTEVR